MIRFSEKYRPQRLEEIVGQEEAVEVLSAFCRNPYPKCWCFVGEPGTGKSSALVSMIRALLPNGDEWPGYQIVDASEMGIDDLKKKLVWLSCTFLCPTHRHIHALGLEEMARLSPQCQEMAKSQFELGLGERAVVIATSNGLNGLQPAFVQRFTVLHFDNGPEFKKACYQRAREIWHKELCQPFGLEEPDETELRRLATYDNKFSFRQLLDNIEQKVMVQQHNARPAAQRNAAAEASLRF